MRETDPLVRFLVVDATIRLALAFGLVLALSGCQSLSDGGAGRIADHIAETPVHKDAVDRVTVVPPDPEATPIRRIATPTRGPTPSPTPTPTPAPTVTPTPKPTPTPEPRSVRDIIGDYRSQIAKEVLENGDCSVDSRIQSPMRWWLSNSLAYIRAYTEVPDLSPEDVALVIYFLDSERGRYARLCKYR